MAEADCFVRFPFTNIGEGGIRTPGTLEGHNSLAGSPIRPLSHLSSTNQSRSRRDPVLVADIVLASSDPAPPASGAILAPLPRFARRGLRFESPASPCYYIGPEQEGFEPSVPCGTAVFKTASLNPSDTAPINGGSKT